MFAEIFQRRLDRKILFPAQVVRNRRKISQHAAIASELIKMLQRLRARDLKPFRIIFKAELAQVRMKIPVAESFKAAVVVDRVALPLKIKNNIRRACLLFYARLNVLFGVANFCPAVVPRNFRRRVGVNHRRNVFCRADFNLHFGCSSKIMPVSSSNSSLNSASTLLFSARKTSRQRSAKAGASFAITFQIVSFRLLP